MQRGLELDGFRGDTRKHRIEESQSSLPWDIYTSCIFGGKRPRIKLSDWTLLQNTHVCSDVQSTRAKWDWRSIERHMRCALEIYIYIFFFCCCMVYECCMQADSLRQIEEGFAWWNYDRCWFLSLLTWYYWETKKIIWNKCRFLYGGEYVFLFIFLGTVS